MRDTEGPSEPLGNGGSGRAYDGPSDPLGPPSWPHRSKRLPERPNNWERMSPEARKRWEDFRAWYRDQLEDEERGRMRRRHGY